MINRQVVVVSRPTGITHAEYFSIREASVVRPAERQTLVRNEFLSVEPELRGPIADCGNYTAAVAIGSVIRALAVGEVVESRHPRNRYGVVRPAGAGDDRRRRGDPACPRDRSPAFPCPWGSRPQWRRLLRCESNEAARRAVSSSARCR